MCPAKFSFASVVCFPQIICVTKDLKKKLFGDFNWQIDIIELFTGTDVKREFSGQIGIYLEKMDCWQNVGEYEGPLRLF